MKYAVYPRGRNLEKNIGLLDLSDCVAVIDKDAHEGEVFHGLSVYKPEWLIDNRVDLVIIFTDNANLFAEIHKQLITQNGMSQDRIVHYRKMQETLTEMELYSFKRRYLLAKRPKSLLIAEDAKYGKHHMLWKEYAGQNELPETTDYCGPHPEYGVGNFIYGRMYNQVSEIDRIYDLALCPGLPKNVGELLAKCRCIGFFVPFSLGMEGGVKGINRIMASLKPYGKVVLHTMNRGWIVEVVNEKLRHKESLAIFQVTHRPYSLLYDEHYIPIAVGDFHYYRGVTDAAGDNIAIYNPQINECTALYWAWKNTDYDYVGLCHYRRYLAMTDDPRDSYHLQYDDVMILLQDYDILLTRLSVIEDERTIGQRVKSSVADEALYERVRDLIYAGMKKHHPESYDFFCKYMNGNAMYGYHTFVMSRELLNDYCNWLFPMILEVVSQVDVSQAKDAKSRRVVGYFTECMLTVWVLERKLKIKELPKLELWWPE